MGMRWDKKLQRYVDDGKSVITSASSKQTVQNPPKTSTSKRKQQSATVKPEKPKQNDFLSLFVQSLLNPMGTAVKAIETYRNTPQKQEAAKSTLHQSRLAETSQAIAKRSEETKKEWNREKLESIGQAAKKTYENNTDYKAAKSEQDALDMKAIEDNDMILEKGKMAAAALTSGVSDEATRTRLLADVKAADDLQAQRKAAGGRVEGFKNEAYEKVVTDEIKDIVSTINNDKDAALKVKTTRDTDDFQKFIDYAKNGTGNPVIDALDQHGANILGGSSAKTRNAMITDDEITILAYLIGDGQKDRAKRYLEDIVSRDLDARASKKHLEDVSNMFGGENATDAQKVGAGTVSVLTSPQKLFGIGEGIAQSVKNAATGGYEPINTNSMLYAGTKQNRELRGLAVQGLDGVAAFAANTAMSIGDTLMTLPFGGGVAPAIMAGETMSDSTLQAAENGATTEQATALGLANGAAAYVLEKVGIDNMFATADAAKQLGKNGFKEFVRAAGKQAAVEGTEELSEEAVNILADIAILGDKGEVSAYIDQYLAEHPGSTQAQKDAALAVYVMDRLGQATLGGIVSGGIFGAGAQMVGNAQYKGAMRTAEYVNAGMQYTSDIQSLIESSLESAPNTRAFVLGNKLQQKLQNGKILSEYEIGQLAHENDIAIAAEQKAQARQRGEDIRNKLGIKPTYNNSDVVELADGSEAVVINRDGDSYVVAEPGKTGYGTIGTQDISRRIEKAKAYDKYYAPEKKAQQYYEKARTDMNRVATRKFAEDFGRAVGVNIGVRDFVAEGRPAVNGMYDPKTDTIYFDKNATQGNVLNAVLVHELAHATETSGQYQQYFDFVIDQMMGGDPKKIEAMAQQVREKYRGVKPDMTTDEALSEVVAAYTGQILYADQADIDVLVQGQPNIAARIYDSIKTAIKKLTAYFKGDTAALAKIREYQRLENGRRMFERALRTRSQQTGMQRAEAYTLNQFGLEEYTEKEIKQRSNSKSILFAKNEQDIVDFVNEYVVNRKDGQGYKRLLVGKIGETLADRIYSDTGIDVENYNVVIRSDFENVHGNEVKEGLRGQTAITPEIIAKMPEIIGMYDKAYRSDDAWNGEPSIVFEKDINGRKVAVEYISNKKQQLYLQTMFGWAPGKGGEKAVKKKNPAPVATGNNTHASTTSKTNSSTDSLFNSIIPPPDGDVNSKFSLADDFAAPTDADVPPLSDYEVRPPADKDIPSAVREYIPHPTDANVPPATEMDLQTKILKDALAEGHTVTPDEFKTAYTIHKDTSAEFEAVDRRLKLTESEKEAGKQIAAGNYDLGKYTGRPEVLEWARAYEARGDAERVMHKYRLDLKRNMRERAAKAIEKSDLWKDKIIGIQYTSETAYRNNIDVMAKYDPEGAELIQRTYFDPVSVHEAEANRYIAGLNDRIKALGLSEAEAVLVQAYGEKMITDAQLDNYGKNPFRKIEFQNKDDLVRNEFSKDQTIDPQKVRNAAVEFRKIYDELIDLANDARVRNGYAPIEKRADYFPHFNEMTGKEKMLSAFGIDITGADAIPEGIAGITEFFNPGTKFFKNFQERKGIKTGFNAIEGFDGYIRGIKDVIFHTDDIQNLRALESALRSRHADETIRQKIDEINADPTREAEAKQLDIQKLLKNTQESNLSGYITWLHEYTNGIAGKKSALDRQMEQLGNRKAYTVMRKLSGRVASNMIGYNVGSWLTNFIPLAQAQGQIGTRSLLKGMKDTMKNWARNDGFVQNSDFLVNRRGTDVLSKDALQKFTDAGVKPMEWIDNFVSETIVRAKYAEEIKSGSTPEESMRVANQTAANILADRSYGQMPTIFNAKNPLVKTLTMFQLEVNNQYRNLFKDLPRAAKTAGGPVGLRIAVGLLKYCVAAWLYNELYEKLTGRRPAFDPIGIVKEATKDFTSEEVSKSQAATNLASNVLEEVPFVGGIFGGGRVPVSSAIPFEGNINDMASTFGSMADGSQSAAQKAGKELLKPAWYILPPGGGGAVKKATEAATTISQGGEYGVDKDGNKKLKFATDGEMPDWIRGLLFGKYATDGGKKYVESGFKQMSVPQTTAHSNLVATGVKPQRAQKIIQDVSDAQSDVDSSGETITGSKKKNALEVIDGFKDLNADQKYSLYYDMLMTDTMKEDMDVALDDYGISKATLVTAYKKTYGVIGDKDENGETIPGSKGKKVKAILDKLGVGGTKAEQEARREYLCEIFGVGKNASQQTVENQNNIIIKDAEGYDIPNYKAQTLEKIAAMGVSTQDYAYVDDRISAQEDKVGYIQSLGFDEKQTQGLVENLVMGKTAKSKMTVAEDMGIPNDVYIGTYITGYTSEGSKAERNNQIRQYVDSLPGLSQDQKEALYEWNKVTKGRGSGSTGTGRSGGRRSSGSRGKSAASVLSIPQIPDAAWTNTLNAMKRNKVSKVEPSGDFWGWYKKLVADNTIRQQALKQQLEDIDNNPLYTAKMKAAYKAQARRRYQEGGA